MASIGKALEVPTRELALDQLVVAVAVHVDGPARAVGWQYVILQTAVGEESPGLDRRALRLGMTRRAVVVAPQTVLAGSHAPQAWAERRPLLLVLLVGPRAR